MLKIKRDASGDDGAIIGSCQEEMQRTAGTIPEVDLIRQYTLTEWKCI